MAINRGPAYNLVQEPQLVAVFKIISISTKRKFDIVTNTAEEVFAFFAWENDSDY